MTVETETDLLALKLIGKIVGSALKEMLIRTEPGMTTQELDDIGRRYLELHGARSAPQLAYNFPGTTCISINEEAAHGIPGNRIIKPGDVLNIDVSAELNGYFADTGATMVVPPATAAKDRICQAAKLALRNAMAQASAGMPLNAIGKAIEKVAKQKGYKVIKNLCSHGVGRQLHEEPKEITGYFNALDKRRLWEGLVITIEPFLSTKTRFVQTASDGWTLLAEHGSISAQYEHTMVITKGQPLVLTAV
jgi:methionyl aminopeptidase